VRTLLNILVSGCLLFLWTKHLAASDYPGAAAAYPAVQRYLEELPFTASAAYDLTTVEIEQLVGIAADSFINIFELLDCAYRYLGPRSFRARLSGDALRDAERNYDYGDDRIKALIPIEKIAFVEVGAPVVSSRNAMDIRLFRAHSQYIELGTAVMEPSFGFRRMSDGLFEEAYGVAVKRFPFSTELQKLELYAPAKGAIYVKALSRPKRWNLKIIKRR